MDAGRASRGRDAGRASRGRDAQQMRAKGYNEIRKQQGKQAAWGLEGASPLRKEPAALAANPPFNPTTQT